MCLHVSLSQRGRPKWIPDLCGCLENSSVLPTEVTKKCREGYPEPSVVFSCRTVLLKLCFCGRRVHFDVLLVDNNLESMKGAQSITVTAPVQGLKYSSSCPADLSYGFANVDFANFFWKGSGIWEVSLQSFWFSHKPGTRPPPLLPCLARSSTSKHLIAPLLLHWLYWYTSSVLIQVHIFCLQNSSALSCCDRVSRLCDRLWI